MASLAIVKFNKCVKESTTVKSAKNTKPARPSKSVTKDILGDARKILQKMAVILEMTVLTTMEQIKLQIRLLKQMQRLTVLKR